jgi:hypothetical protein
MVRALKPAASARASWVIPDSRRYRRSTAPNEVESPDPVNANEMPLRAPIVRRGRATVSVSPRPSWARGRVVEGLGIHTPPHPWAEPCVSRR